MSHVQSKHAIMQVVDNLFMSNQHGRIDGISKADAAKSSSVQLSFQCRHIQYKLQFMYKGKAPLVQGGSVFHIFAHTVIDAEDRKKSHTSTCRFIHGRS